MNCKNKSSIYILSNIIEKNKYISNPTYYLPYDQISDWARDIGLARILSNRQRDQKNKNLLYAKTIVKEEKRFYEISQLKICNNCEDKDICW